MRNSRKANGFTLIELMIVVAVIGIIYAIAYPSYMNSVRKTNRAEAKSELSEIAQRFQRCHTLNGKYKLATNCKVYEDLGGSAYITTRGSGFYKIELDTSAPITDSTFTLKATALKSPQTEDTVNGCNVLKLDQNGTKTPVECW